MALGELLSFFGDQACTEPFFFFRCQEFCIRRMIGKYEIRKDAKKDSGQSFENQEPALAAETQPARVVQDQAGDWSTDDAGNWQGHHEKR